MVFLNPWAWLGLLALAVPVLIHLLGRRSAHVEPFPTLRFLGVAPLVAVRRTRPSDLLLLFVRLLIVLVAVGALAQPLLLTADRRAAGRTLTRVILVDTSGSMRRLTPAGEPLIDVARRMADSLASGADVGVIVPTAAPATQIEGASAWLEQQPGTREVVVVSDFQAGALDTMAVARGIGVRLERMEVASIGDIVMHGARVSLGSDATTVEWLERRLPQSDTAFTMLAGADERAAAEAARHAASVIAPPESTQGPPIAIVHTGYPERDALLRDAVALDEPWMGEVIERLRRDDLLASTAADAVVDSGYVSDRFLRLAANRDGEPVVIAARGGAAADSSLMIFVRAEPGSLVSAALYAAISRARNTAAPATEHEPDVIPDDMLRAWEREAEPDEASGLAGASDGRWLWLVVLLLLGLEAWMRRARRVEE